MSIWDRMRGRRAVEVATPTKRPEKKSRVLGLTPELGSFLILGTEGHASTPTSALQLYEQSSAVSVPVNMIAEAFASVEPILLVDGKKVQSHPILDLLKKPSPYFSTELFLETMAKHYLVTGEAPFVAIGNVTREPLELQPLSPKNLTAIHGSSDAPDSWQVSGNTLFGNYRKAPVVDGRIPFYDGPLRELTVIRAFSTRDNSLLRGQSPLVSASREAMSHILGTTHNVSLLERGGRVSLVFHYEEDMDEDDFEEVKDRIDSQYAGANNAGRIGVSAGGKMDVKELGITPKDMDYKGLQAIAKESCALVYRVPLPIITADRQTLNNYREGKLALYDDAVIPLSKRIYGGIGSTVLPRYGLDPARARLALDPDDVTALVSRRNDELKKRREIGVESPDELRALMGREAIEGGNVLYLPAGLTPAGSDLFTADQDPALLEDEDGSDGGAAPAEQP